jgi:FAD/FMN-containing dehydrogenase
VRIFDRYARLREALRDGHLHTGQKEVLAFLKGRLSKSDLPAAIVEPAGETELKAVLAFAAEKHMKVAVASGIKPVEVRNLEDNILVLTTRMAGAPLISASRRVIRAEAGLPVESLSVDLTRAGLRWMPLLPVPAALSLAELVASGWEGLRNWNGGSLLDHISAIEWLSSDGRSYRTEALHAGNKTPDVSGLLFGSRGACGIMTALELIADPLPASRTATLFELPEARAAYDLMTQLREMTPQPEAVIYWGEAATQILREGNDGRVSEKAVVMLAVEWGDDFRWPDEWEAIARPVTDETALAAFWQDILRFPRTAQRLYPERTGVKLHLPADAIVELEEAAREFGRDFNFPVALWGTLEAGHLHAWVLQPDDQPRTARRAEELLKKLIEAAVGLGGSCAAGTLLPAEIQSAFAHSQNTIASALRSEFSKRCDPAGLFAPLMSA